MTARRCAAAIDAVDDPVVRAAPGVGRQRQGHHAGGSRRAALTCTSLVVGAGLTACKPDLGEPASLVSEPRILVVRSEPAEVKPNHEVTYQVL